MKRISLSPDLTLSRIAYGMWRLADDADSSTDHVRAKIDACLDQGLTTLDQADIYGRYRSEALLGTALKQSPDLRQKLEIVSKCGIVMPSERYNTVTRKHYNTSAAHVTAAVEQSLRDLGTDYLDLLLIHRPDPFMDAEDTGRALDQLVEAGKIRAVGVSNFCSWDMELLQSAMHTPLVTNQIELSLSALTPFTDGTLAYLQRHKLPVMAWSPLGGGALMREDSPLGAHMDALAAQQSVKTGHQIDRAAIALAFLLAHPASILPVVGSNSLQRIRAVENTFQVTLSREDWFDLYSLSQGCDVP